MLAKSNFPSKQVEEFIRESVREQPNTSTQATSSTLPKPKEETKFSMALPYYPGIEVLKRRLERLKIKLYFSYGKKLSSFLPSNKKMTSRSVIYEIPCECGASYVGEAKVGLQNRMKQHASLIEKDSLETHSEIVQHHHQKNWQCLFEPEKAMILDVETDYRKRKIKESVFSEIVQSINRHDHLSAEWRTIMNKNGDQIRKHIKFKEETKL
ncbi:unnamed protein product [Didymodactylos carnosus]|uniref:GIY-YIG domain-containing protein n=1 Tax=Didymodactylos carnosus TaxID=1234261 RepID=A0A813WL24_9BILA|nr:unnamed protein product [Didymodactylos carnosus]CAF3642962.1 unnamed protein product [Didymodactylos carnosus]